MSNLKKIIFLGTPEIAVPSLRELAKVYEVLGVVTAPDRESGRGHKLTPSPVKVLAESLGLRVFQPIKVREILNDLQNLKADLAVVVAYGAILPQDFLDLFPLGCVNLHFSLLPRWRGASPVQSAILAGDDVTGITVQKMVYKLDAGDVLGQLERSLDGTETTAQLWAEFAESGAQLLCEVLSRDFKSVAQDETKITLCGKFEKDDGELDFAKYSALELDRRRRAFDPWPGVYTFFRNEKLKILDTGVSEIKLKIGEVSWCENQLLVGTKEGSLILKKLQMPGKKPVEANDFIRGYADFLQTNLTHHA